MRSFRKNQIIEVRWVDIVDDSSWTSEDKMTERPQADCVSVGYYHHKDAEFLYLSGTVTESGERSKLSIPLGTISAIWPCVCGSEMRQMLPKAWMKKRKSE